MPSKRVFLSVAVIPNTVEADIKEYFQGQQQEKKLIVKALSAFYRPAALLENETVNSGDITMAIIDSLWLLANQMVEIRKSAKGCEASMLAIDNFVESMIPMLRGEFGGNALSSEESSQEAAKGKNANDLKLDFD
jgi:hypothetical protein